MGRVRLDSDANELAAIWRTEHVRRSGDVAEGSPDDGFRPALTHLVDPLTSLDGWTTRGLGAGDERVVRSVFRLTRRDPETLPRVVHVRGATGVVRALPRPLDLLHLPVPLAPAGTTYAATALVLVVRYLRDATDDEVVTPQVLLVDGAGGEHLLDVALAAAGDADLGPAGPPWREHRVDALAVLPRTALPGGGEAALLSAWGLLGLPPRADVYVDALLADPGLPESDLVLRGGDGTLAGAGRLYTGGRRSFLEEDWRYSLQPDLPDPAPLVRPAPRPLPDGRTWRGSHALYVDVWERAVHGFEDPFLREPALDGEDTTFRTRQVTQVRAVEEEPDERGLPPREPALPPARGTALLTTNVRSGTLPDRVPAEQPDPCRDRCLTTGSAATGEGYTGARHLNVRLEVLGRSGGDAVVAWARDNGATVAPLRLDAPAGASRLILDPADAARFTAGDVVVVEDRLSRLDPEGAGHATSLRRLRAVDTAEGVLELEPAGHTLTADPRPLPAGGPLPRAYRTDDAAAVRRWDGADWLVRGTRYALPDGLTFAFSGGAPLVGEYWTFTARVVAADGASVGVVEQLTDAPVRGPERIRVPVGRVEWTETGRTLVDLRRQFLPLADVRDRLAELGRRQLSPGGFTIVVGDGRATFGDVDQDLLEGVTGDEAIQVAVDRLGASGGTVYVRKGEYTLEHPVLLQGRSNVRILGDGDATTLRVTGAGGAFYVDWCGHAGEVALELLRLVEAPEDATPFGGGDLVPDVGTGAGLPPVVAGGLAAALPLTPADLLAAAPGAVDVVAGIGERLRALPPFGGRAAASVVRTIAELRRLQRLHPGEPLEDTAPDQLTVLRGLPHGVVTVADSRGVRLDRLSVESRPGADGRPRPSGVLLTGTLEDVLVSRCRILAPTGVEAAPYARYLLPFALTVRPRAGLAVRSLALTGNDVTALAGGGSGGFGVRIADGVVDGLVVEGNAVEGFDVGIAVEDQAEDRAGRPADRTVVHRNRVLGAARTGVSVTGDGVDVAQNEVRLAETPRPRVRAGVAVAGQGVRVSDNWVTLPAAPGPLLGVEAGVQVGGAVDDGGAVARAVLDVEVAGNRVEGAAEASAAVGVLVGGPQPIAQVRVSGNTLRSLGGAGVRAWGHLGPVTDLQVAANTIEAVALASLAWSPAHVAEAAAVAGVDLTGAVTPRDVLARLLAPGVTPARAALDAVLGWLEQASLRGGVVLSLVDGALVDGDRVADVGTRDAQPAPVPDAQVRTAGVALAGGSDIAVRDATIERVRGTLVRVPVGPFVPPVFRPPVLDLLRRFEVVSPSVPSGLDLHGAAVALRELVMDYTLGDGPRRQVLGGRIYAALDAVTAGLEAQGESGRRLAEQLAGATDAMRDAQGAADHTRTANLARAVLSDAAALTAASDDERQVWTLTGSFDRALLHDDADVVETATAVAQAAAQLTVGLEDLGLDVAGQAAAVVAASGREAEARRLALAATLGQVAQGRARAVTLAAAMPPGGPTTRDTTLLDGVVRLTLGALEEPPPGTGTAETLVRVEQGAEVLAGTLDLAHRELASRLRADVGRAVASRGGATDLQRLTATLKDVQVFAADPATGSRVHAADVANQKEQFGAELAIVTAGRIQQQIAALPTDVETDEGRALRLVQRSTAQLVNLVAGAPAPVRAKASAAARAVADAIADVENREVHRAAARTALQELADEQARLAGVAVDVARPVVAAGDDVGPERVTALAALVAELPDVADPAVRAESLALLDSQVRRAAEGLDLGVDERASLLGRTSSAVAALTTGGGAAEDAVAAIAAVVDELADRAARREGAAPEALATRTLTTALRRATTPRVSEADRILDVRRSIAGSEGTLSPALAAALARGERLADVLGAVRGGLAGLLPLPPRPPTILPPPVRLEPQPADGVFAAGVGTRLGIRGTSVETVRSGAVVAAGAAHPLAPVDGDAGGVALAVERNRVLGAVLRAIDLAPAGTCAVDLVGNEVTGCAGLAESAGPDAAGAVVRVAGRGELVVDGNRLRRNGDPRWHLLLHELVVDWRGDVTVQDNVVRHGGAGSGGAGVLVITDDVPAGLVGRLAQEPALAVEPPPAAPPPPPVWTGPALAPGTIDVSAGNPAVGAIPGVLGAGLGGKLDLLQQSATFGLGGAFKIAVRDEQPVVARLTQPADTFLPALAVGEVPLAAGFVDRFTALDTAAAGRRLVEILRRPPDRFVLPFRPSRRAVHVVGNDVVAAGPALLVVCEGANLASVTVVGNELESAGTTGAVYLRQVDSTVFATNRCESLRAVTVAVVRGRQSVATVTGNVLVGAQPATPPPRPLPWVRPDLATVGDLTLSLAVGPEATLTVPLDSPAMLEAINAAAPAAFADRAEASEISFGRFAKRTELTADPRIRQLLATGTVSRLLHATGAGGGTLALAPRVNLGALLAGGSRLAAAAAERAAGTGEGDDAGAARASVAPLAGAVASDVEPEAVELLLTTTNAILGDRDLDGAAKLFGIASTTGMTGVQAKAFVQAQLSAAGGDAGVALSRGLASLTGIEDPTPVSAPQAGATLLEDVVALALRSKSLGNVVRPLPLPVPPRPPAPDPRRHSLVVLGCARAGVLGNISTAGVLVADAGQSVQNNL
jgi:hypothetical protein